MPAWLRETSSTNLICPPQLEHASGSTSKTRLYRVAQSMRDRRAKAEKGPPMTTFLERFASPRFEMWAHIHAGRLAEAERIVRAFIAESTWSA